MPVTVRHSEGWNYPHVVCNYCGKAIKGEGNVAWLADEQLPPNKPPKQYHDGDGVLWVGEEPKLYYLHKYCTRAFEEANPGVWLMEELPVFFYQLIHNSKIDLQKGKKWHDLREKI